MLEWILEGICDNLRCYTDSAQEGLLDSHCECDIEGPTTLTME